MSTATAARLDLPPIEDLELVSEFALTTLSRLTEIKEELERHSKGYNDGDLDLDRDSIDVADVGHLLLFADDLKTMGRYIEQAAREVGEETVSLWQAAHNAETHSDLFRRLGFIEGYAHERREWIEGLEGLEEKAGTDA